MDIHAPSGTSLSWQYAVFWDLASCRYCYFVFRECLGRTKSKCLLADYLCGVGKSDIGIGMGSYLFHDGLQCGQCVSWALWNRSIKEPDVRQSLGWPI